MLKSSKILHIADKSNTKHRKLTRFTQQTQENKNGIQIPVSVDIFLAEQESEDVFHAKPANFKQAVNCYLILVKFHHHNNSSLNNSGKNNQKHKKYLLVGLV